jgi:hypothetical protein
MGTWHAWRGRWALLAAGSIGLMGAVGSAQPSSTSKETPPPLKVGDGTATACVVAKLRWNHTGIRVEKDGQYLIEAEGTWWDARYRHGPGGGESPNALLRMFERFRRFKTAPWFELICALDSRQDTAVRVGCRKVYEAKEGGELTCYANDVWLFYFNNTGQIEIKVTRTR